WQKIRPDPISCLRAPGPSPKTRATLIAGCIKNREPNIERLHEFARMTTLAVQSLVPGLLGPFVVSLIRPWYFALTAAPRLARPSVGSLHRSGSSETFSPQHTERRLAHRPCS